MFFQYVVLRLGVFYRDFRGVGFYIESCGCYTQFFFVFWFQRRGIFEFFLIFFCCYIEKYGKFQDVEFGFFCMRVRLQFDLTVCRIFLKGKQFEEVGFFSVFSIFLSVFSLFRFVRSFVCCISRVRCCVYCCCLYISIVMLQCWLFAGGRRAGCGFREFQVKGIFEFQIRQVQRYLEKVFRVCFLYEEV